MIAPRFGGLAMLLAGTTTLTACASVPDLGARPEIRAPESIASAASFGSDAGEWPAAGWWRGYGDAQLDGLMREAIAGSPDLRMASARLRKAQAYARQAGAALLPQIDATSSAGFVQQSENNGVPAQFVPDGWEDTAKTGISFSLDLDLWGKNRAALAAATSDAEAARIELEQSRLVLSTNIASAYADLAQLAAERRVQENALRLRTETQKLVSDRVAAGLDTRAESKQADSAVPAARATLAATDEAIGLTRNRIAALLGKGPDRGLTIALPVSPAEARSLPAGVTTDLIGRRPDIAAARARVEAAASRIKVARADFYPSVNLSALIGFQSLGLSNLFDRGSTFGQAGPAISLPIFRGGQLAGQYKGARAGYDEAVANYDGAVATAFREVADAVTSQRALAIRLSESRQALADSEAAYGIARQRYEGGLSTFLDVLTAEERVLQNRQIVVDLEARAFTLDVQLVRALGGGFSNNNTATAARKDSTHG